jgi:hypothetical protein
MSSTEIISVPTGIVKATFTFINGSDVKANESVAFVISNIGNPSSTKPVKAKTVTLLNGTDYKIAEMKDDIPNFSI